MFTLFILIFWLFEVSPILDPLLDIIFTLFPIKMKFDNSSKKHPRGKKLKEISSRNVNVKCKQHYFKKRHPWHPLSFSFSFSFSSLLSTQSLALLPVLSLLWEAVTPLYQAAPAAVSPPWVRVTLGVSILILDPSGTMPWSLFQVTCGPHLTSTWRLPTCTSTTAEEKSTPWTRFALSTTAALRHTRTTTRTLTLMPTQGWTATHMGHQLTTTPLLMALITSLTADLSLQLFPPNPTWERAAFLRRTCHLNPSRSPAGSSIPLMATERTRANMPGSSASARSTRRHSDLKLQLSLR